MDDQPLPLYGDGQQRRDWLHVDDHADAVAFVLDHGEMGGVYNISGQEERTNREVAERLLRELDKPWSLVRAVPDRPAHDRRYALDGSRLHALGWFPRVPSTRGSKTPCSGTATTKLDGVGSVMAIGIATTSSNTAGDWRAP